MLLVIGIRIGQENRSGLGNIWGCQIEFSFCLLIFGNFKSINRFFELCILFLHVFSRKKNDLKLVIWSKHLVDGHGPGSYKPVPMSLFDFFWLFASFFCTLFFFFPISSFNAKYFNFSSIYLLILNFFCHVAK